MARTLYFGRSWNEPGYPGPWINFEDNPNFTYTDYKYSVCRRCLIKLAKGLLNYEQGEEIDIEYAGWRQRMKPENTEAARDVLREFFGINNMKP